MADAKMANSVDTDKLVPDELDLSQTSYISRANYANNFHFQPKYF